MTPQEKHEMIRFVLGTLYTDILDYKTRNGTDWSLTCNILEYDYYADHKELSKRDALEWICKNFDKPNTTNDTLGVRISGNKVDMLFTTIPDDNGWRKTKYSGMNCDQRSAARAEMEKKSFVVLSLMKRAGWPITLFKRKNTDLHNSFSRNTVGDIMKGFEMWKNDESMRLKGKRAFYFKDGSSYYLYSVSPQYFDEVMEVVNFLEIKIKIVK